MSEMPHTLPPERLRRIGVVPVITIPSAAVALPLVETLAAAGLDCVEITLRTDAGLAAIREVRRGLPGVLVGAGTVLTADSAREAIAAGAQFIVTPGFSSRVVAVCVEQKVAIFPGVMTPTEIGMALDAGLTELKFFPSEAAGGVATLRALAGPFPTVRFIPTGGIDPGNLASYLREPTVLAVGGSWMTRPELLESRDWTAVRVAAEKAVETVREIRGVPTGFARAGAPSSGARP
jgi:2-dehydro-3-deoxyphosphogluconate aldolase/(4S)-4-hydroxy-2-oxoglutarate aldolase